MNSKKYAVVVRQHVTDDWDPDAKVEEPVVVGVFERTGDADRAIVEDAKALLAEQGYDERDDKELFEDFVDKATADEWASPNGGRDEWRWTVEFKPITAKKGKNAKAGKQKGTKK